MYETGGGLSALARLLNGVEKLFIPLATKGIAASLARIQELISRYPPQPPRDRAKSFNTYVRGVGSYPKAAFKASSKAAGGFRVSRKKAQGHIRYTSEQMDKRYRQSVKPMSSGVEGILRNEASYSGWVIGSKDGNTTPHQVSYHTETGWPNKDDTLSMAREYIDAQCDMAVTALLQQIVSGGK